MYNHEYLKHSSTKIIKTISHNYYIKNNSIIVRKYNKKFIFATHLPFTATERFINDSLENLILEINLINITQIPLHITNLVLNYGKDTEDIPTINNENDYKNVTIEPYDEINIVYILKNPSKFNTTVRIF